MLLKKIIKIFRLHWNVKRGEADLSLKGREFHNVGVISEKVMFLSVITLTPFSMVAQSTCPPQMTSENDLKFEGPNSQDKMV